MLVREWIGVHSRTSIRGLARLNSNVPGIKLNIILQNILLGLSIAAPIGPASIAILKSGFRGGFGAAIKVAMGVVSADVTYVLVAYFGLAGLITIPAIKTTILFFGMFVLAYLGYHTIKEASRPVDVEVSTAVTKKNLFLQGYAVNISNPMAVVWWLGVIGSILATTAQGSSSLLTLPYTLTIVLGIFIWHTGLSLVSHFGQRAFSGRVVKTISIFSGLVLIGFALRFGYNAFISLGWLK
jgi:L-lysine exporter family protein LysE/ArgO